MQQMSRGLNISDVDVTVMGNNVDLSRALVNGVRLELDNSRILELREGLARMPEFEVGSDNNPLILGSTGKASHFSSRISGAETGKLPDVQVTGVSLTLDGNRLIFNKEGVKFFVRMDSTPASAFVDTLTAGFELNEPIEQRPAKTRKKYSI